jgi:hypothetical protein
MPRHPTTRSLHTLYDDPVPDPYPEADGEVWEFFREQGYKPEDLQDPQSIKDYTAWLEANPK